MAMTAIFAVTMGVANAATITSAGPLTEVITTPDLNCSILHASDSDYSFFGSNTDRAGCGTFVTDGTTLYQPDEVAAGPDANGTTRVAWTPVSQDGPTGSGTTADPYKLVTKVTGGPFTLTQTDTYILGDEFTRSTIQVTSSQNVPNATIYRAGDCYLQDSDEGGGSLDLGIAPTCTADSGATDPDRILQFFPLTGNSNHIVDGYTEVWDAVETMDPLPDTIETGAGSPYDNAMGLSWTRGFAANETQTFALLTTLSPTGLRPLTVSKTVTPGTVAAGEQVTYTIKIDNTGTAATPLTSIVDDLPAGFTYVPGSTTGAITSDPTVSGSTLTWPVSLDVPAASGSTPGSVSISFDVTVSSTPGTYTNTATAVATTGSVIGATDVAPVVVTAATTTTTMPPNPTTTMPPNPTTTMPDQTTTTMPDQTTTTTVPDQTTTTTVPDSTTTTVPESTTTVTVPPSSSTIAPATTANVVVPPPAPRPSPQAPAARPVPAHPAYTG